MEPEIREFILQLRQENRRLLRELNRCKVRAKLRVTKDHEESMRRRLKLRKMTADQAEKLLQELLDLREFCLHTIGGPFLPHL